MTARMDQGTELEKVVDQHTDYWVRYGFLARDAMLSMVAEGVTEEFYDLEQSAEGFMEAVKGLMPLVHARVDVALAQRAIEEANWPMTDCDRLDAAFERLEAVGILCRQDFGKCSACGHRDLSAEAEKCRKEGVEVYGWLFFCTESTVAALQGNGVSLVFRSTQGDRRSSRLIGKDAVQALTASGLHPAWFGRPNENIAVPLTWMRRITSVPTDTIQVTN